jgi:hypothetical protein
MSTFHVFAPCIFMCVALLAFAAAILLCRHFLYRFNTKLEIVDEAAVTLAFGASGELALLNKGSRSKANSANNQSVLATFHAADDAACPPCLPSSDASAAAAAGDAVASEVAVSAVNAGKVQNGSAETWGATPGPGGVPGLKEDVS